MSRLVAHIAAALALLMLASCSMTGGGPIRRPLMYDVREVAVIANAKVPLALVAGTDRRVAAAIHATRRAQPMRRVVLTVNFEDYRSVQPFGDRRAMTRVRVTAADIETGDPVAAGTFVVHSTTDNPSMADENLAEEVASRIRFAFTLQPPRIARPAPKPRTQSTRLAVETANAGVETPAAASVVTDVAPAVVPAPMVPAPVVASGTNVEEGASGAISLGAPAKTCDVVADPTCNP